MKYISALAKRRILRLCTEMESLPREATKHFDMQYFFRDCGEHEHDFPRVVQTKDLLHACGTSACAAGFAGTMPFFQKLGLKLMREGMLLGSLYRVFDLKSVRHPNFVRDRHEGKQWAWSILFAEYHRDRSPKAWAKRVRRFIADLEKGRLSRGVY